ncbi:MAG: hypothetical protein R3E89_11420 [Thiolinea sp.]
MNQRPDLVIMERTPRGYDLESERLMTNPLVVIAARVMRWQAGSGLPWRKRWMSNLSPAKKVPERAVPLSAICASST